MVEVTCQNGKKVEVAVAVTSEKRVLTSGCDVTSVWKAGVGL
jgi:hypothetical protein